MTALPDTIMPDRIFPLASEVRERVAEDTGHIITGLARKFLGSVSITVAFGFWMFPVVPGDTNLQLIKLFFSICFFVGGLYGFLSNGAERLPEITVDAHSRRVCISQFDAQGRLRCETYHHIDALGEVVLRDHWLTARDTDGRQLISIPVNNSGVERMLRKHLFV